MIGQGWREEPVLFACAGERLLGIITRPDHPVGRGVLITVGGPQYRAGSHRQFTLLARQLAAQGIASLRFDYRGMGDSEGEMRNFEAIDADIRAAIDAFLGRVAEVRTVALWGLCDAASAALYYGHTDPRVDSLVLLNPWVHSATGAARARLKHYYLSRLLSKSFWTKLVSGRLDVGASVGGLAQSARQASQAAGSEVVRADPRHGSAGYIDRMLDGFRRFSGVVDIILSGQDLTAQEFVDLSSGDPRWAVLCRQPRVAIKTLKEANHTFSSRAWRDQVAAWTAAGLDRGSPAATAGVDSAALGGHDVRPRSPLDTGAP